MLNTREIRNEMEDLIRGEIRRLASSADVCVFALYDPEDLTAGPIDFQCFDRETDGYIDLEADFDFEGVGVWYIARRKGETFSVRKVLVRLENGRFTSGQVGTFEGFWDEFPQYVAEDKWVQSALIRNPANDQAPRSRHSMT